MVVDHFSTVLLSTREVRGLRDLRSCSDLHKSVRNDLGNSLRVT